MNLLFLCKRNPHGTDLLTERRGRFYFIPKFLANRGHTVKLLVFSHHDNRPMSRDEGTLSIESVPALPFGPLRYIMRVRRICNTFKPDWVIGNSDIWYGMLSSHAAAISGCKSVIDAYDNYESYFPIAKPFHLFWRKALSKATIVTAAGPELAQLLSSTSGRDSVTVLPMSADPEFVALPKNDCRRKLGLPLDHTIIGYTGSLHRNRGIDLLLPIYEKLRKNYDKLLLVVSGRLFRGIKLPKHCIWLGKLDAEQVPLVTNSLDLMLVFNKPGDFGNYSYPAKLYEAIACNVPVVASNVPGTAWILRDHPEMLARPGDVEDFVSKANALLSNKNWTYSKIPGWEQLAIELEKALTQHSVAAPAGTTRS